MPQTPTTDDRKILPRATPAQILYDCLMSEIEPELTSVMLPQLAGIYEGETTSQACARLEHYRWAFSMFADMWEDFVKGCEEDLERFKRDAFTSIKTEAAKEEAEQLRSLEEKFDQTNEDVLS